MSLNSAREIWEAALGELQVQVSKANYDTWLKDTVGLRDEGNIFVVGTPRAFAVAWLEQRLHSLIRKILIGVTGRDIEIQFETSPAVAESVSKDTSPAVVTRREASIQGAFASQLNPNYTFDSFIVGECNRLACAVATSIVDKLGCIYNPLFIYGGVGLGKTHLLNAIGNATNGYRVIYTSAEQFTNEYISAIREKNTGEFRHKFREVDLLLIDDIHFLSGKKQTQEGFFHTFNDLYNTGRQIVISCDCPPSTLPSLEGRLRSRFEGGLIVDLQLPDIETRLAILQSKARKLRSTVPLDTLDFIAARYTHNIRELEGALNRVITYAKLTQLPLSLELSQAALEGITPPPPQPPSANLIIEEVSNYFGISPQQLTGRDKGKAFVLARQVAMYLIREETKQPLSLIGKLFSGRDHSTVIHNCKQLTSKLNSDPLLLQQVLNIQNHYY